MSSSEMIVLISSDGKTFEVEAAVVLEWQTIKEVIEAGCTNFPLFNVRSNILARVIEYSKRHAVEKPSEDELKNFDADFVNVDQDTLFDLIMAADYLNIRSLLDLTCETLAGMVMDKTEEEVCKIFNIENDFTPKEEEEIRMECPWIFEMQ